MSWFLQLIVSWLAGEIKDLWADGTIREIAREAVEWAEASFEGNEEKQEKAIDRMLSKAEEVGKELSHEGSLILIEKAVQRFLK
jgi:effector-binding domain-containing protein